MTPCGRYTATTATVPRSELPPARLVLGAAAAAFGLFAALHWIVLPGDRLWLDQKNGRTESVTARESAKGGGSRRNGAVDRVARAQPAPNQTAAVKPRRGHTQKAAPRTAGHPTGSAPATKQPGAPTPGEPTGSGGDGPAPTETPTVNEHSPAPPPPLAPPPPPLPPPPIGLPQLPQVPEVPQVPAPSVPDLPKPQVPTVPTPQLPKLP
jgi:hypothetical protein